MRAAMKIKANIEVRREMEEKTEADGGIRDEMETTGKIEGKT
jgi:hypothetical protein